MHVCAQACMHTHTHTQSVHASMHVCTHADIHPCTCMDIRTHARMHMHTHTNTHASLVKQRVLYRASCIWCSVFVIINVVAFLPSVPTLCAFGLGGKICTFVGDNSNISFFFPPFSLLMFMMIPTSFDSLYGMCVCVCVLGCICWCTVRGLAF